MTAKTRFRQAVGSLVVAAGILAFAAPAQAATVYYFHLAGNTKLYLTMDGQGGPVRVENSELVHDLPPFPQRWLVKVVGGTPSQPWYTLTNYSPPGYNPGLSGACRTAPPRDTPAPQPAGPFELVAGARRGQRSTEGHRAGGWIETAGSGLPGWRLPG